MLAVLRNDRLMPLTKQELAKGAADRLSRSKNGWRGFRKFIKELNLECGEDCRAGRRLCFNYVKEGVAKIPGSSKVEGITRENCIAKLSPKVLKMNPDATPYEVLCVYYNLCPIGCISEQDPPEDLKRA